MPEKFERDSAFEHLERFRASLPERHESEVMADIDEAVSAARQQRRSGASNGAPPPVRIDPPAEAEEMGGEQPCQAHQFWDLEDD
jgi:hypothetical protein